MDTRQKYFLSHLSLGPKAFLLFLLVLLILKLLASWKFLMIPSSDYLSKKKKIQKESTSFRMKALSTDVVNLMEIEVSVIVARNQLLVLNVDCCWISVLNVQQHRKRGIRSVESSSVSGLVNIRVGNIISNFFFKIFDDFPYEK